MQLLASLKFGDSSLKMSAHFAIFPKPYLESICHYHLKRVGRHFPSKFNQDALFNYASIQ